MHGVSGVKNFKYVCSGILCCVLSDQSEIMTLYIVFNLWIRPGFIFESGLKEF
jgi:hypothetical protein